MRKTKDDKWFHIRIPKVKIPRLRLLNIACWGLWLKLVLPVYIQGDALRIDEIAGFLIVILYVLIKILDKLIEIERKINNE